MSKNTSEYNREYYLKHKEKLQSKKARRYKEDPEYRKQLLKRARFGGRERNYTRPLLTNEGVFKGTEAYSLIEIAIDTGVNISTLRDWVNKGTIPKMQGTVGLGNYHHKLNWVQAYILTICIKAYMRGSLVSKRRMGDVLALLWDLEPSDIDKTNLDLEEIINEKIESISDKCSR